MEITLPLDQMTVEEKLRAMEAIWADLSRNAESIPSPAWHGEVLREREERVRSGQEKPIPWERAKRELQCGSRLPA
jgi:hypothetical protein